MDPAPPQPAAELWSGRPSQLVNAKHFLLAALVIAAGGALIVFRAEVAEQLAHVGAEAAAPYLPHIAGGLAGVAVLWAWAWWLRLASRRYRLVEGTLEITTGLLSQRTDLLDLFRVRDLVEYRPFAMRLCGLGTIRIISGDATTPDLELAAIRGSHRVLDLLRAEVARSRGRSRVVLEERE